MKRLLICGLIMSAMLLCNCTTEMNVEQLIVRCDDNTFYLGETYYSSGFHDRFSVLFEDSNGDIQNAGYSIDFDYYSVHAYDVVCPYSPVYDDDGNLIDLVFDKPGTFEVPFISTVPSNYYNGGATLRKNQTIVVKQPDNITGVYLYNDGKINADASFSVDKDNLSVYISINFGQIIYVTLDNGYNYKLPRYSGWGLIGADATADSILANPENAVIGESFSIKAKYLDTVSSNTLKIWVVD